MPSGGHNQDRAAEADEDVDDAASVTPSVVSDISGISMPSVADEPKAQAGRKPGAKKIKKTKKAAGGSGVVDRRVATRGVGSDSTSKGSGSVSRGSVYGNPSARSAISAKGGRPGPKGALGQTPSKGGGELSRTPSKAGLSRTPSKTGSGMLRTPSRSVLGSSTGARPTSTSKSGTKAPAAAAAATKKDGGDKSSGGPVGEEKASDVPLEEDKGKDLLPSTPRMDKGHGVAAPRRSKLSSAPSSGSKTPVKKRGAAGRKPLVSADILEVSPEDKKMVKRRPTMPDQAKPSNRGPRNRVDSAIAEVPLRSKTSAAKASRPPL